MSKKDTTLFLRPGMASLLLTKPEMPAGAVGYGTVLSVTGARATLTVDDATVALVYEGPKPEVDAVVYFNGDGKMVAMEVPAKKTPAPARATTGAAHDVRPNTLY